GIERDTIGDLLVTNDSVKIICEEKMADFLLTNLDKIGAVGVACERSDLSTIAPKEERCKEIRATVASLRVDSIAAAGFGSSRSKAASDIAADKLKINWQPAKSASQNVKEGDILSMRGRGRLEVAEVRGTTKKGRTVVVLKRYL
ncbi:MAG: RNA-binding protein, partial [Selenomonas sp.]